MNIYATKNKPEKNIDITLPKFLVIVITVIAFFVIPAQIISYSQIKPDYKNDVQASESISGRVAGASTSVASSSNDIIIDLKDRSTQFILIGGFFVVTSLFTLLYLIQTEKNYRVDEINKEFQERILGNQINA